MHKKSLLLMVVILFIVTFAAAAFAQGPAGMARRFMSPRVQARLNLTPDQLKQIMQVVQAQRANAPKPAAAPALNAAQEHRALLKAIFTDKPDQEAIQQHAAALNQFASAQAQQHSARLNQAITTMLEINKILTPEQRDEFQRMLDENARVRQLRMRRGMMARRGMGMMMNRQGPPATPPPSVPKEQ